MPANLLKEDLRYIKTERALDMAMFSLLSRRNFRKITVHNICTTALISRATFYAHYTDKYDLLKDWLLRICPHVFSLNEPYEYIEHIINKFIFENKLIIKNIITDASRETLEILRHMMISFFKLNPKTGNIASDPKYVIFYNIYANGIIQYISWQVENNFPAGVRPMNRYLYEIIKNYQALEMA